MRKFLFWIHLAAGCLAGLVIFIMSVTGVLLAYERQIVAWADAPRRSLPAAGTQPLPPSALLRDLSGRPATALTLRADLRAPAEVTVGRDKIIFVDRYTGAVVGEGSPRVRALFRAVTGWHRWLAASDPNRASARAITGACNLTFFVLILTGSILWLPKQWSWMRVRQGIWFRRGLAGRARDWSWHNTVGVWMAAPLGVIVFCAIFMSYPWANSLLYRAAGSKPPERTGGPPGQPITATEGSDKLWIRAGQQAPDWQSITLRGPAAFSIDRGTGGRPDLRSQLTLDPATGEVIRWESFSSFNKARRVRTWMRFLHTGEAGGSGGQAIAATASAGAAFLVWTGISLALRRLVRRIRKSRQGAPAEAVLS
ncbi:MAG TPA: PepSY-associated TM helix domain-containing protein [Bryobacteraceae bacterium]|nr:PepSY-associated TM helix domain-containing protein [Bryobacteraceae bacterium]